MKKNSQTITKDNIAAIALLYNYVTNKETELSSHKIDKYFFDVKSEFMYPKNKFNDVEFIFSNETINYKDFGKKNICIPEVEYLVHNYLNRNNILNKSNFVNLSERDLIGVSLNDSGEYVINDIESVVANFNSQPLEIISATLNAANLNKIDIIQSRLDIEKTEKDYSGYKDIFAMDAEKAKEIVKQSLKDSGFQHIKISSCYYIGMNPDHVFRVYYTASKKLLTTNICMHYKEPGNYRY